MVRTSLVAAAAGLQQNANGGAYLNGKEYGTGKKGGGGDGFLADEGITLLFRQRKNYKKQGYFGNN